MHYGTDSDPRTQPVDIESECDSIKGNSDKQGCWINDINLEDFNGEEIEYWFTLTDMVGSEDESRHYTLDVDTEDPFIINNPGFYTSDDMYIYFNIEIDEDNLDEVTLSYDYNGKPRERRLCTRLKDGICEKKFRMRDDYSGYQLNILDEAGNSVGYPVTI